MNIKKFGKRLSKINRLFDGITEDGEVSKIEKDLLLSYIREAYEYALYADGQDSNIEAPQPITKVYKEPEHHVPPTPVRENVIEKIAIEEVVTPVVQKEIPAEVKSSVEVVEQTEVKESVIFSNLNIDPALQEIFDGDMGGDLSDRLSMSPVKDMNKSMGINERIFTVKELFGNDNELFTSIMDRINQLSNYDEAKNYLATGIAKDQDWGNENKIKKAEKFIKLVKRRFA